ncbi:MAG: molybdate ABC transporter substrate-binding protein [Candidatus Electrothrix sp. GM3_4]|nr:molybdate ABC transporter substrate-binding protein [Candidatus Electrothrix sp. GM3_4]
MKWIWESNGSSIQPGNFWPERACLCRVTLLRKRWTGGKILSATRPLIPVSFRLPTPSTPTCKVMIIPNKSLLIAEILVLSLLAGVPTQAEELRLLCGGGYKKPMQAVIAAYQEQTSTQVVAGYGNMRQILSQAKASGKMALVIGDEKFLHQEDIFAAFQPIGIGKLVIAWARSNTAIGKAEDLTRPEITRIAHPDRKKAIYGRAATEWLRSEQLSQPLHDKLLQLATAPQVSAYLVAGEVDAGFINLVDAIGLGDKIGGYLLLTSGYEKIAIVAGIIQGYEEQPETKTFLEFLTSAAARHIFQDYGL